MKLSDKRVTTSKFCSSVTSLLKPEVLKRQGSDLMMAHCKLYLLSKSSRLNIVPNYGRCL